MLNTYKSRIMKTFHFLSLTLVAFTINAYGQKPTMKLTFTSKFENSYVQLNSIKVMNRTRGSDTVLNWPDTVLVFQYELGIRDMNDNNGGLCVFQNYPNPVIDQTLIKIYVPEKNNVRILVSDILGKEVFKTEKMLDKGYHSFRFTPGNGTLYFFTARYKASSSCIRILHSITDLSAFDPSNAISLEYTGIENSAPQYHLAGYGQPFLYKTGDELLYIDRKSTRLNSSHLVIS